MPRQNAQEEIKKNAPNGAEKIREEVPAGNADDEEKISKTTAAIEVIKVLQIVQIIAILGIGISVIFTIAEFVTTIPGLNLLGAIVFGYFFRNNRERLKTLKQKYGV